MYADIYAEAQSMQDELVSWRRALHQVPEIGLELPQTVAIVTDALRKMDIPFRMIANGSGVLAQLGQGDRCLLLRADMDALPILEETDLPFAASNGNMHACGHDFHATALLGAAKLLKKHESELKCTVKLLFQPGEETFSGARACIADGVLENPTVHAAVATHVSSFGKVGQIYYGDVTNASVYGFKITIHGKGTHGAMPDQGIDPINVGVHIYQGLQALIARECAPSQEATLTIGQFAAGTANNVIPDTCVLQGSLRTFDAATRDLLVRRISEVTEHCAAAFGTTADIEVLSDLPTVHCDPALNDRFAKVFASMDPHLAFINGMRTTASEDFSLFAEQLPVAFYMIAAGIEDGPQVAHHNPKTCFNERALPLEAAIYTCAALDWE